MLAMFPLLAKEASGWDPSYFFAFSGKKMAWKCGQGHDWEAIISNRTNHGQGCPFCKGTRVITGVNDLATKFPHIAVEAFNWDPSTVKHGAIQKRKWQCSNGHVYEMAPNSRTQGRNCPECAISGYKTDRAAWIYLITQNEQQKIGITNVPRDRLNTHKRNGWHLVHKVGAMDGYVVALIESQIKKWLKQESMVLPGTHENWLISDFKAVSVYDVASAAGVDEWLWHRLIWGGPDGLSITPKGETPMANRPPITAAIDLTADTLNALKAAGPNERGNYSLDLAVWPNERKTSDRAPGYTGTVKVKGDKDGSKGKSYASVWVNEAASSDDLF